MMRQHFKFRWMARICLLTVLPFVMLDSPVLAQSAIAMTDPNLADTDGDGYLDGKTVWVDKGELGLWLQAGEDVNGDGKIDWDGRDDIAGTEDDESDPNAASSMRKVKKVIAIDSDRDGLSDTLEKEIGTDPLDVDSDNDGLADGDELWGFIDDKGNIVHLPERAQWARRPTNPIDPDTDGDGLPDGLEMGMTQTGAGYAKPGQNDYNAAWYDDIVTIPAEWREKTGSSAEILSTYMPKHGPRDASEAPIYIERFIPVPLSAVVTITDPWVADSDHDGIPDHAEDKNRNGVYESAGTDGIPGNGDDETDPSRGLVNLPPPVGWNGHEHGQALWLGLWHNLTQDCRIYLGFKNLTLQDGDSFDVFGRFGLCLGAAASPMNLSLTGSNWTLAHGGLINASLTGVDGWMANELSGPAASVGPFSFSLTDTATGATILSSGGGTGGAGGAFSSQITIEEINGTPCTNLTTIDETQTVLDAMIGRGVGVVKFVFDEIKDEIREWLVAETAGAAAGPPGVLVATVVMAGYDAYQLVQFARALDVIDAMKIWFYWKDLIREYGNPRGISPPEELCALNGVIVALVPALKPPLFQKLTNMYFNEEIDNAYGFPTEWYQHKTNAHELEATVVGVADAHVPYTPVEYIYSENFLTRTLEMAMAASGFHTDPVEQPMYLAPASNCVYFETDPSFPADQEFEIGPHEPLAMASFGVPSPSRLATRALSVKPMTAGGSADPFDPSDHPDVSHPIRELGGAGTYDIDVFGITRNGGVYFCEQKSGFRGPNMPGNPDYPSLRWPQGSPTYTFACLALALQYGPDPGCIGNHQFISDLENASSPSERARLFKEHYGRNGSRKYLNALIDSIEFYRADYETNNRPLGMSDKAFNNKFRNHIQDEFDMDAFVRALEGRCPAFVHLREGVKNGLFHWRYVSAHRPDLPKDTSYPETHQAASDSKSQLGILAGDGVDADALAKKCITVWNHAVGLIDVFKRKPGR